VQQHHVQRAQLGGNFARWASQKRVRSGKVATWNRFPPALQPIAFPFLPASSTARIASSASRCGSRRAGGTALVEEHGGIEALQGVDPACVGRMTIPRRPCCKGTSRRARRRRRVLSVLPAHLLAEGQRRLVPVVPVGDEHPFIRHLPDRPEQGLRLRDGPHAVLHAESSTAARSGAAAIPERRLFSASSAGSSRGRRWGSCGRPWHASVRGGPPWGGTASVRGGRPPPRRRRRA